MSFNDPRNPNETKQDKCRITLHTSIAWYIWCCTKSNVRSKCISDRARLYVKQQKNKKKTGWNEEETEKEKNYKDNIWKLKSSLQYYTLRISSSSLMSVLFICFCLFFVSCARIYCYVAHVIQFINAGRLYLYGYHLFG